MKLERIVAACAAAALSLGLAVSAKAEIVTVTYQGVVASGVDQTGLFGLGVGKNLTGDAYTIVFTINDAVSAYKSDTPGLLSQIVGGTEYPSPTGHQSPVSAAITIKGHTVLVPGVYQGAVWQEEHNPPNPHAELFEMARDNMDDGVNTHQDYIFNQMLAWTVPMMTSENYHVPMSYTVQPGKNVVHGEFSDYVYNDATHIYSTNIDAMLRPESITITDGVPNVPSVPEPATWAMLILGVGMIGCAARRRNEAMAVAA